VVATGGCRSQDGATGWGIAGPAIRAGVVEPRPALVPLLLGGEETGWTQLAGVAAEVVAQAGEARSGEARFREKCW